MSSSSSTSPTSKKVTVVQQPEPVLVKYDPLWYQSNLLVGRDVANKIDEISKGRKIPVFSDSLISGSNSPNTFEAANVLNSSEILKLLENITQPIQEKIDKVNQAYKNFGVSDPTQLAALIAKCTNTTCVAKPEPFPPNQTLAIFDNLVQKTAGGVKSSQKKIDYSSSFSNGGLGWSRNILWTSARTKQEIENAQNDLLKSLNEISKLSTDFQTKSNYATNIHSKTRPAWFMTAKCILNPSNFVHWRYRQLLSFPTDELNQNIDSMVGSKCGNFTVLDTNQSDEASADKYGCNFDTDKGEFTFTKKTHLLITFGVHYTTTAERNYPTNIEHPACWIIIHELMMSSMGSLHVIRGPEPTKCGAETTTGTTGPNIRPGATETCPVVAVGVPGDRFHLTFIERNISHEPGVIVTMTAVEIPRKWAFSNDSMVPAGNPITQSSALSSWADWGYQYGDNDFYGAYNEWASPLDFIKKVNIRLFSYGVRLNMDHYSHLGIARFKDNMFPSLTDPDCYMAKFPPTNDQLAFANVGYPDVRLILTTENGQPIQRKCHFVCMLNAPASSPVRQVKNHTYGFKLIGGKKTKQIDNNTIEITNGGTFVAMIDHPVDTLTVIQMQLSVTSSNANFYDGVMFFTIGMNIPSGRPHFI